MSTKRYPPLTAEELPDLRRSSDITWGQWLMCAGEKAGNLHHILIHASTNPLTMRAIRRACQMLGKDKPTVWPGDRIKLNTEIGKALLGTPNGRAVPYFLSHHRATLGHKAVFEMNLFFTESDLFLAEACFLFYIQSADRHDSAQ
ncbi:Nn.00g006310.m01.CDS01 [Neocucurbitaria sp. VM-36]